MKPIDDAADAPNDALGDVPGDMSDPVARDVSSAASDGDPHDASRNASHGVSRDAFHDVSRNADHDASRNASHDASRDAFSTGAPDRALCEPGRWVDSDHPSVVAFAQREAAGATQPRDIAVRLYHAVRDGIRYDPYDIDLTPAGLTASRCIETGRGFCVTKAALLAAVLRVHGIPTRLGFADVRNHLTSPRLRATMQTDLFVFHGYTDVWLDGRWVKATPAFNLTLCQRAGTAPLDFDGRSDSILQPYDLAGRRHMEYVQDRGVHADVPYAEIVAAWEATYPATVAWKRPVDGADFEREVESPAR